MDASYDCLVDIIKSDPGAFTACGPILEDAWQVKLIVLIIATTLF